MQKDIKTKFVPKDDRPNPPAKPSDQQAQPQTQPQGNIQQASKPESTAPAKPDVNQILKVLNQK
jgi:hypothetical protein